MFGRMQGKGRQSPTDCYAASSSRNPANIRTTRKTATFSCLGGCWTRGDSPQRIAVLQAAPAILQTFELRGKPLRSHVWADAGKEKTVPNGLLRCKQLSQSCKHSNYAENRCVLMFGRMQGKRRQSPTDCCAASSSRNPANIRTTRKTATFSCLGGSKGNARPFVQARGGHYFLTLGTYVITYKKVDCFL